MSNDRNIFPGKRTGTPAKGETIRELAHRHLMNENHTTTDEELENARVELTDAVELPDRSLYEIDNTPILPSLPFEDGINKNTTQEKYQKPNPYKVLGG